MTELTNVADMREHPFRVIVWSRVTHAPYGRPGSPAVRHALHPLELVGELLEPFGLYPAQLTYG